MYLHLGKRVLVGSLEQDGDAEGVLALFNKGKLILSKNVLVYGSRITEAALVEILKRVDGDAAARERETLHVAPLGAAKAKDALAGERVQGQRVDALLVQDHERFLVLALALAAHLPLEFNHLKGKEIQIIRLLIRPVLLTNSPS
jgi:hypothetical protein